MKKKNLRIVDIAKMANVSAGTVDRVIHNRGLVSEEKRILIEKILDEYNYKPNIVASFLASKKHFKFAMIIPTFKAGEYWDLVQSGSDKAEQELSDFNVSVDYLYFDQFSEESFEELIPQIEEGSYDGVVIATLHREKVIELSKILDSIKIPYVFIDSNIPECNNISYFGIDSYASGAIAAKLMLSIIGNNNRIIIIHPIYKDNIISTQTENRELGFTDYLYQNNFNGEVKTVNFNPSIDCIKDLRGYILENNIGIVTFNSRIYEIIDMLNKAKVDFSNVCLIGYDAIERNKKALKDGSLKYLISQRSIQQGYESIKSLSNYLIFGYKIKKENLMPIDILIKENISFYQS